MKEETLHYTVKSESIPYLWAVIWSVHSGLSFRPLKKARRYLVFSSIICGFYYKYSLYPEVGLRTLLVHLDIKYIDPFNTLTVRNLREYWKDLPLKIGQINYDRFMYFLTSSQLAL